MEAIFYAISFAWGALLCFGGAVDLRNAARTLSREGFAAFLSAGIIGGVAGVLLIAHAIQWVMS